MGKLETFLKITRLHFGSSIDDETIAVLILDKNSKVDYSKFSDGFVKISINEDIYYATLNSNEQPFVYNCSNGK